MAVTGRLELAAFDAPDIKKLAEFYTALTGWQVVRDVDGWITIRAEDGQEIALQEAPDHVPPRWPDPAAPQQMHLDLFVEDNEAAAVRAESLGATRLATGSDDGAHWITLADPAGHPFDLCRKKGIGPGIVLFAVNIDAPDAAGLARFYSALMGMEVVYEGSEGAMISGGGKSVMFQQVAEFTPPRWPDPAAPQQAHLDIQVEDLDAGEARAIELGATRLPNPEERFRVFADPAGHPFCLTT
ncbi:VOC family protein [Actinophytocola algeriensis]|uniref:Catechol 2,3-dioxygenase-like lactoylglutathione lyase family enzyme n=1 Tax=Actinophytocola algeriensis TaxID=1768010 RepID=A0A7W7Q1J4_9PSEU|nr:VOC family protein [Actinophytocola algeriensis]MBB4905275.1 catechol 2,3-dioxygenase-like lactoylglutathione lyase family enzyme [Actinophytocola algeriensis]MBE1473040.1 catechol 2,3-dioxygenase-like lactoylglutathione lyase family enzyme [Actinophytocola algeriensis]